MTGPRTPVAQNGAGEILCSDGSRWREDPNEGGGWQELPPVPGSERERELGLKQNWSPFGGREPATSPFPVDLDRTASLDPEPDPPQFTFNAQAYEVFGQGHRTQCGEFVIFFAREIDPSDEEPTEPGLGGSGSAQFPDTAWFRARADQANREVGEANARTEATVYGPEVGGGGEAADSDPADDGPGEEGPTEPNPEPPSTKFVRDGRVYGVTEVRRGGEMGYRTTNLGPLGEDYGQIVYGDRVFEVVGQEVGGDQGNEVVTIHVRDIGPFDEEDERLTVALREVFEEKAREQAGEIAVRVRDALQEETSEVRNSVRMVHGIVRDAALRVLGRGDRP